MARRRIGLQINSLTSGYNIDIFNSIEDNCRQKDHDLIVFEGGIELGSPAARQQHFIYKHINKNNIDGLIIASGYYNAMENEIKTDKEKEIPIPPQIAIAETKEGEPYIYSEFEKDYVLMIEHMIKAHNCKTFNIVSGPESNTDSNRRMRLCLATLAKYNIQVEKKRLYVGGFTEESGFNALHYYIKHNLLPVDCIICLNDDMAVGLIDYATTLNYKIPEDFSVIGFDDSGHAEFNHITITTVGTNLRLFGAKAVECLESLWQGESIPPEIKLPASVKFRKSCGCIDKEDFNTNYRNTSGQKIAYPFSAIKYMNKNFFRLDHDIVLIQKFFENQMEALTIPQLIPQLKKWLPKLNIRSCIFVLFENKIHINNKDAFEIPSKAEILLAYEEGIKQTNTIAHFNPQEYLYPPNIFSNRRKTSIVKTLYYNNFIYGYIVYEPENLPPTLYDTTYSMITHVFYSSIFVTEKLAMENHQNIILQQLEKTNTQLTGISQTDELTKLYNRRGFFSLGQQTINLAAEMGNRGLVFYADMDGLKRINDTYGHDSGDTAITAMAQILRQTFRTQDVIGRLGGDEFVIVATGVDRDFIPKLRQRIKESSDTWYFSKNSPFRVSISFGAVEFGEENTDLEKLLSQADKLLYEEKIQKHTRSTVKE